MVRFFVAPEELEHSDIILTGENAQHAKVLRLKAGEEVLVCGGNGMECLCKVSDVAPGEITLDVLERRQSQSEARVKVRPMLADGNPCRTRMVDKKEAVTAWMVMIKPCRAKNGRFRSFMSQFTLHQRVKIGITAPGCVDAAVGG